MNHPKGALAFSVVVLLALGLPALTMKIDNSNADTLPQSIPEIQTYHRLQAAFPSGVCDWSEPGIGQQPTIAWQTYQDRKGRVIYGGRPLGPAPARSGGGWASDTFRR